jgi:N-acetylneuraminic acid mutarotase
MVTLQGRVYVFGGTNGTNALSTVYAFDTTNNVWMARAAMPEARQWHRRMWDRSVILKWKTSKTLQMIVYHYISIPRISEHGAVALDTASMVLVCGGLTSVGSHSSCHSYAPTTNAWTENAKLNTGRFGHGMTSYNGL